MTQSQKYLRAYIRVQAVLLCLILGTFGACLAAQRTRILADGEPAAARQEHALPQAVETLSRRLPDKPDLAALTPYLAALPAPYGCMVGAAYSVWETAQTVSDMLFGIMHK